MTQPALQNEIFAQPLPDFFPERLRSACAGKHITFRLPASVRERMQVPNDIDGAEWADKHHRVTAIDSEPGPWRSEMVPHTVKALKFASAPHVRKLWLCWPERGAKTHVLLISAKRIIDRGIEAGNIFWLMPNEQEAKKALGVRIIPSLKASPRTARLLSRYADDTTRTMINFRHGAHLFPAWAGSAASVSSFYGRLCIGDEIDKAETAGVGKETDILTLLFKRGRDSDNSQFLLASTPAQGYIYKGAMGCEQVWEYRLKCPHCGEMVALTSDNVIIPEGATAEDCAHGQVPLNITPGCCGTEWSDHHRRIAYREGDWVCIKGADIAEPATVGMHMTAYVLPNIPLTEIAEKIIKARTGGETEKKALANGYDCKDYEVEKVGQIADDHILKFKSELPRGLVPPDTAYVVITTDTQQDHFYYTMWAFGYRDAATGNIPMHMIQHDIVKIFADVEGLLYRETWKDHEKRDYRISVGLMDSGGTRRGWQKHSRTVEVYDWTAKNRVIMPYKGSHGRAGEMLSYKTVQTFPGTNKAIPGGLTRANIRVDLFKDELESLLAMEPDNPRALSFHCNIDEHFAKHFTTETKDVNNDWIHNRSKGRNDYFDCTVAALALREMLKLQVPTKEEASQGQQGRRVRSSGVQ